MFDIVGAIKAILMITTLFTIGLLTWVIIGLVVKYAIKGLIKLCEKLCESLR